MSLSFTFRTNMITSSILFTEMPSFKQFNLLICRRLARTCLYLLFHLIPNSMAFIQPKPTPNKATKSCQIKNIGKSYKLKTQGWQRLKNKKSKTWASFNRICATEKTVSKCLQFLQWTSQALVVTARVLLKPLISLVILFRNSKCI